MHRKTLVDTRGRLVQVYVSTNLTADLQPIDTEAGVFDGGDFLTGDEALQFGSALVAAAAFLASQAGAQ